MATSSSSSSTKQNLHFFSRHSCRQSGRRAYNSSSSSSSSALNTTRTKANPFDKSPIVLSDDSSEQSVLDVLEAREVLLEDEELAKRKALDNYGYVLRMKGGPEILSEIDPDVLPMLLRLPTTRGDVEKLRRAKDGYEQWEEALKRGLLPKSASSSSSSSMHADVAERVVDWPEDETFREALLETLGELDMARFTRKFPPVLKTLMRNVLDILYQYEVAMDGEEEEDPNSDPRQSTESSQSRGGEQEPNEDEEMNPDGSGAAGDNDQEEGDPNGETSGGGSSGDGDGKDETDVDDIEMNMESKEKDDNASSDSEEKDREKEKRKKEMVEKMMEEFKEQWEPAVDKLEKASKAFEGLDLNDLTEGPEGFDLSKGLWQVTGWEEMEKLRKKLQDLKELRDIVRSLGRGSGRGPLKRAPRQRERNRFPEGLTRSPMEPEQTSGLTRSDDISRVLPAELQLLAMKDSAAARRLHFARRAERTLATYERVGWAETPAVTVEGFETRPAAECGPIIVCLDTSGSMMGARETVAKCMTLECARQARTTNRPCFLYAFSGPGDCMELELKVSAKGLSDLLTFLEGSFHGGTDVDEPFERALARLDTEEWENADILLVTDGEIKPMQEDLLEALNERKAERGLKVHGLVVGEQGNPEVVESVCTHTHNFRSWSAVM
jgi:uncharacterized protein with von Willebrand factor type A (vWA) domain